MNYELDKKDVKIIFNLFENGRMSLSKLGKEVGLSKNSVKNRIERLQNKQIIQGFTALIDHSLLGLDSFTLLLEFNDDIYENKKIQEFFVNHDFSNWVATLSGKWDLLVEFIIKDNENKIEIIEGIVEKFGELINNYKVYSSDKTLRIEHLIEDLYKDLDLKKEIKKKKNNNKSDGIVNKINLDEIDKKILHYLASNSLENYVIIAQKLNLTIDIVKYRIKKLLDSGIISKFIPLLETNMLGYTEYLYLFTLRNSSKEVLDNFKNKIRNHPNILYAFSDITSFSLFMTLSFKYTTEMDEFSRKVKKEFGKIISSQDYFMITENLYFNLFPKGLL